MKFKQRLLAAVSFLVISLSSWADEIDQSITVEQAYSAVPHQRTIFDADAATMNDEEKQFLSLFFELSDLALIERVSILKSARSSDVSNNYGEILIQLMNLHVPAKLTLAHQLVVEAVKDQKTYLERWKTNKTNFNPNDPLVESAHNKLIQAYGELIKLYPQESAHNKQAFYDYLCALDFK